MAMAVAVAFALVVVLATATNGGGCDGGNNVGDHNVKNNGWEW